MKKRFKPYKSKRTKDSFADLAIRARKDEALFEDARDFLTIKDAGTGQLVDRLLNSNFDHRRYTDPSYPI